jgi:hypothetical protein
MHALTRNRDAGNVEGLGIHSAVEGIGRELAKGCGVDIARGQDGFVQVLSGAGVVVMVCEYVGGSGDRVHGKDRLIAGGRSGRIRDHDLEFRKTVGKRCWGSDVSGRGRARNSSSSLLPLVAQRGGPAGDDRESCRLAYCDALRRRLASDGWSEGVGYGVEFPPQPASVRAKTARMAVQIRMRIFQGEGWRTSCHWPSDLASTGVQSPTPVC